MENRFTGRLGGFTLIELLFVIILIGVLTVVALPKYQTAVDKSRYAALMPTAKNIAQSQEVFYMTNGDYTEDLSNLDTTVTKDASGTSIELGDGTKLEISQRESHKYVKMSKDNLDNNYIVYQERSPNYAKEIHCEALKESERAERLCTTLGGKKINGYLTAGYDTYVLEGSGLGLSADVVDQIEREENSGWQSCDTYPCTKTCNRPVSSGYTCEGTYQEDGSYSERVCQGEVCVNNSYDKNGKKEIQTMCQIRDGLCYTRTERKYDENGNIILSRECQETSKSDGSCLNYFTPYREYTYDDSGNKTSERGCIRYGSDGSCTSYSSSGYDYTYDENGNKTSERRCSTVDANGKCTSYRSVYDYTYDEQGNMTSKRICSGSSNIGTDGRCTSYYPIDNEDYVYDENGHMIAELGCSSVGEDGSCMKYGHKYSVSYDENGNISSKRGCNTFGADGSCAKYEGNGYEYTYDTNGNKISVFLCTRYGADGACMSYNDHGYNYYYTYDTNGHMISERNCRSVGADGNCVGYNDGYDYTYDANGNRTSKQVCYSFGADGSCTSYSGSGTGSYSYQYDEDGNLVATRRCYEYNGTICKRWSSWS